MIGGRESSDRADGSGSVARGRRLASTVVGLLLLLAAAIAVGLQHDALGSAWRGIEDPPAWAIVAIPLSTLASLAIGTILFDRLLRDVPDLRRRDLAALVASSTLFNLLPLKAGLVGRAAWQRRHQQVPLRRSALVAVQLASLSVAAVAVVVAAILAGVALGIAVPTAWAVATVVAFAIGLSGPAAWRRGAVASASLLLAWRLVDVAIWSIRVAAGFALLGIELAPSSAAALACVAAITGLVPIVGTTLGVREWVVALLAPSLAGVAWEQALAAELLARGIEVVVVALAGGVGTWWLWRRSFVRTERPEERADDSPT